MITGILTLRKTIRQTSNDSDLRATSLTKHVCTPNQSCFTCIYPNAVLDVDAQMESEYPTSDACRSRKQALRIHDRFGGGEVWDSEHSVERKNLTIHLENNSNYLADRRTNGRRRADLALEKCVLFGESLDPK